MRFLSYLLCTKEAIEFFNETSYGQDLLKVCTGIKQPARCGDSIKDTSTRLPYVWILFKEQLTGSATKKVPDATQLNINQFIKMVWGPDSYPISICEQIEATKQ